MASPFAEFNDQMLAPGKVLDKFRELYPDDNVLFFSSGFIVKRIFRGDRRKLRFPAYGNHHLGALVISNKRLFFWNRRRTPYDIMMKVMIGFLLATMIPSILLLTAIILLLPPLRWAILVLIPTYLLITFAIGLVLHQHREVMLDKRLSDAKALRLNGLRTLWIGYDMIDHFDGEKTVHFAAYHPFNDQVKRMVRVLKVGEIVKGSP